MFLCCSPKTHSSASVQHRTVQLQNALFGFQLPGSPACAKNQRFQETTHAVTMEGKVFFFLQRRGGLFLEGEESFFFAKEKTFFVTEERRDFFMRSGKVFF